VAGGLAVATLEVAKDSVASLEEFGARMLYVHGSSELVRRYNHARAVVKKECALSYETLAATGNVRGPAMLSDLDSRLERRRSADTTGVLRECEQEHLLGHAFVLTSECIVWWSTCRDLGSASDDSRLAAHAEDGGDD
jgi:hypothetical protein